MTPSSHRPPSPGRSCWLPTAWLSIASLPLWIVGMLCLVSSAGCRGCVRSDTEKLTREELEKKAKEQKEALVTSPLLTLPADTEVKIATAKPGHWVETVRQVKSNREDLQVIATGDVMRGQDKVLNIPYTTLSTEFTRATILPKGQTKTIDLQYFVPTTTISVDQLNPVSTALRLRSSLLSRSLLTPITQEPFSTAELSYGEFLMTVVSPRPQEYAFLSASDFVLWRGSDLTLEERTRSYRVILCGSKEGKIELPTSLLTMTAIAVIVWDDLAPDDLSEDQKTALIDWLHWGGQLVISGPGSWSRLQNSFLSPYLPVRSAESKELGSEELADLNHWVVPDRTGQPPELLEIVGAKLAGLSLELADGSSWLPHAEQLVAEKAIGRGRLVMTAFPLREQRLYRWKYYSSLFSTGLLRRPAREVTTIAGESGLLQTWAGPYKKESKNPLFNSNLRIATRDMPLATDKSDSAAEFAQRSYEDIQRRVNSRALLAPGEPTPPLQFGSYKDSAPEFTQWAPNGCAWSDTSGFSFAALSCLRSAAGIVLPTRTTIITLIGAYLAILVPVNWLVFRLLGRLELAWLVAPILAIVGVLVVTRVARLDIGFARRTTELGLLELHGEYPRGHVTTYTALYTSLSTPYALEFPERGSVALPFGNVTQGSRRIGTGTQVVSARYGTSAGIRLEPLNVRSNSLEMLHAEQMVGLPGGILYGVPDAAQPQTVAIKNTTGLKLRSCCLVRKTEAGGVEFGWIGDMPDDSSRTVNMQVGDLTKPWEYWNKVPITRHPALADEPAADENLTPAEATALANELLVGGPLASLLDSVPLVNGQVRLLGFTDDRPGKMDTQPNDGRLDTRCLVMAHLRPAAWTPITRDLAVIGRLPNAADQLETREPTPEDLQ